jgi:hypothetical protein
MGEGQNGLGGEAQDPNKGPARRARRAAFATGQAGENLAGAATNLAEDLRETAGGLAHEMSAAAESLLDEQKARMADMAHGFANALRRSADAFAEEGGGAVVARYADQVAEQVDHLSDAVRHQHWRDLLASVEDTARRRPELFFAGAIAAGFLVGRMLTGAAPRDGAES